MQFFGKKPRSISSIILIAATSLFLVLAGNAPFFRRVSAIYPLSLANAGPLVSLATLLVCLTFIVLNLMGTGKTLKLLLTITLIIASLIAYAGGTFGIVADDTMITNLIKSDGGEVRDLITLKLMLYTLLLGVFPSLLIWKAKIEKLPWRREMLLRAKAFLIALAIASISVVSFGKFYASYLREHKETRSYINPVYFYYSAIKFGSSFLDGPAAQIAKLGIGAKIKEADKHRDLVILVVGETARADHLSLNGYGQKTNPRLEKEGVISLSDAWSCGTSTAVSVPCMFSNLGRSEYSDRRARKQENVLDIIMRTGKISVLWRDNNSDSKGVADRVPYEDFTDPNRNPVCDAECRDEGMLSGLQAYIDGQKSQDILIVLHQMGNHGPAYFKRYPKEFARFQPACATAQLEECSETEIINAYDNAILYTDHMLAETINLLKKNSAIFETALVYMSDHGESLGERGVYLHGLPYMVAPDTQKKVAAVLWLGESMKKRVDPNKLAERARSPLSHDNLFHSLLGIFEVQTGEYKAELDLFH